MRPEIPATMGGFARMTIERAAAGTGLELDAHRTCCVSLAALRSPVLTPNHFESGWRDWFSHSD
jgi:hypothetical protein